MQRLMVTILFVVLSQSAFAEGWGHLEGEIVLDGDIPEVRPLVNIGARNIPDDSIVIDRLTKGVANVCVYLPKVPEIHPDLDKPKVRPVKLSINNLRYDPRIAVVRTDQQILVSNDSNFSHEIHTSPFVNPVSDAIVQPNRNLVIFYQIPESLPVKVGSDTHPWMRAWWLVVDHPYATITNKQGKFRIEKLPAGEHTFRVWHERTGYIDRKLTVTIEADQTTRLRPIPVLTEDFK